MKRNHRSASVNRFGRSKAIATNIAILVVIIILLGAVLGYVAIYSNKGTSTPSTYTTSSGVTSSSSTPSSGTQQVSTGSTSTAISTKTFVTTSTSIVTSVLTDTTSTSPTTSSSSTTSTNTNPLILYSADAYVNESTVLEQGFTSQTGIRMASPVAAGSSTLAANICSGNPVSVFLSVSRSSVEGPALCSAFPGWAVAFAGDQMALAYSSVTLQNPAGKAILSSYSEALSTNSSSDWYNFFNNLTSGSVKVGISNPNSDPAGYRGWMVLQLAGIAYDNGTSNEQYFVNRMLANHCNVTGSSAASLVPALATGQIQFLFIYKSDISSEGLNLVQLPNGVNLGFPTYNTFYAQATYSTTSGLQKGSAIVLWLTVPKDSTDLNDSVSFVVYTIENYQNVLKSFGLTPLSPGQLYNTTGYSVPAPIESLLTNGILVDEGPV